MGHGTLFDFLRSNSVVTPLVWPTRLHLATQAAEAVEYLHGREPAVIHRDIKSSNFFVDGDLARPSLQLGDFGEARVLPCGGEGRTYEIAGSLPWMAPEVHEERFSTASDCFSLAVVVWEILTGERPFDEVQYRDIREF